VGKAVKRVWRLRQISKRADKKEGEWKKESVRMVLKYTAGKGISAMLPSPLLSSPIIGSLYYLIDISIDNLDTKTNSV
jgi:hypothetical protein